MARPRSEDKRQAILQAATRLFAEEGLSAPTSRIAKEAGVAEGTLFIYFANKDTLLNELYLDLKGQLGDVAASLPASKDLKEQLWYAWQAYVQWGLNHPLEYRALVKLATCPQLTEETRSKIQRTFTGIVELLKQAMGHGALKAQPSSFAAALMGSMADTTKDFMAAEPTKAKQTCKAGFEAFWNALSKG